MACQPVTRPVRRLSSVRFHSALPAHDIGLADRVRRAVRDGLGYLPYSVWITVEFGYGAELFESRA